MEQTNTVTKSVKKQWIGGYVTAGAIWYYSQGFRKSPIDEVIVMIVAIGSGFIYYLLKSKITIKNEIIKVIITFLLIGFIAQFVNAFLTTLL